MATEGASAINNVAGLADIISKLFLGSNTTKTNKVSPEVSNQFNQIFQSLAPQLQGQVVSPDELQQLVTSILQQSSQAFAPNRAIQGAAGSYNSTALSQMENDARAKATNDSLATIINAKMQNAQSQQNAAQIASGAASNYGQLTGSSNTATPAPLGSLAAPLAAYAGYKYLTESAGAAAGAGAVTAGSNAIKAAVPAVSSATAGGVGTAGSSTLDSILNKAGGYASEAAPYLPAVSYVAAGDNRKAVGSAAGTAIGSYFGPWGQAFGSMVGGELGGPAIDLSQQFLEKVGGSLGLSALDSERLDPIAFVTDPNVSDRDKLSSSAVAFDPLLSALGKNTGINWADPLRVFDRCFITTAVMKAMEASGRDFDDKCEELQLAREFRDTYMSETPERLALVSRYYAEAPGIVAAISSSKFSNEIFTSLYYSNLLGILAEIRSGDNEAAMELYELMFNVAADYAEAIKGGKYHGN